MKFNQISNIFLRLLSLSALILQVTLRPSDFAGLVFFFFFLIHHARHLMLFLMLQHMQIKGWGTGRRLSN